MTPAAIAKSQPLSDEMERRIRARLDEYKALLIAARRKTQPGSLTVDAIRRLEGNIGATEWVLREAEAIKAESS